MYHSVSKSALTLVAIFGLALIPDTSMAVTPGAVEGTVTIKRGRKDKKDRSNVVVFLQDVPDSKPEPPAEPLTIDQTNKAFNPRITVITTGTTVHFPNNDKFFHNVFSISKPATFDLGLYKSGSSKSVTFDRPGVVDIYCNIHPEMAAKVVVLDTKHYAVTGPDGSFSLGDVPPGTYPIVAWQADGDSFEGKVTVAGGQTTKLEIELVEDRWSKTRHTRKDGTPYGRYK
jgi:plastocyanin